MEGYTALHHAANSGVSMSIKMLLDKGADKATAVPDNAPHNPGKLPHEIYKGHDSEVAEMLAVTVVESLP